MRFGVDEAGKGPVLGSMFAAAVAADPGALPDDVGDSKAVAPDRRATLETEVRSVAARVAVAEVPVDRIDDPGTDMNSLTVAAHAEALDAVAGNGLAGSLEVADALEGPIDAGVDLTGTVDASDTDADRFGRRVADAAHAPVDVHAEHGADASDPLVGAASIVAKEAREAHVADLADEYGRVGSGYPNDPKTREFLLDHVEREGTLPDCARASWQTSADVLAAVEQTGLGRYEGAE
ncbi:MAG: ribonuclease HII [Haloarculaceae archaeon]